MKRFIKVLAVGILLTTPLYGASIVVPNSLETVEGNGENAYPFNVDSMRYQQVYVASNFSELLYPELITQIIFRPDAEYGPAFSATLSNVQINLSTTPASPGSMSFVFADNVGPDDVVVHSGPLVLTSAASGPIDGPKDFDIVINLQTPFLYAPSQGNLLLDIRNFSGAVTGFFDAHADYTTSPIARVYSLIGDVSNPVAWWWDSYYGLVTKFSTIPAEIEVIADIKFCSYPNAFNCKSKGVLPVTIFGADNFDVYDIDLSTLQLCLADMSACTGAPRNVSYDDRGNPADDLGAAQCAVIEVEEGIFEEQDYQTPDGLIDLDVAFEKSEVIQILGDFCSMDKNSVSLPLVITGMTYEEMPIVSKPIPSPGVDQLVKR
jgi:hypothetical protein